jgi:hypothetical protein
MKCPWRHYSGAAEMADLINFMAIVAMPIKPTPVMYPASRVGAARRNSFCPNFF